MPLLRACRRVLGIVRRRIVGDWFGWQFESRRYGNGFVFAVHEEGPFIELFKSYAYDLARYWQHGLFGLVPRSTEAALARMTAFAHSLEKGLSYPRRKAVFGLQQVKGIIELLEPMLAAKTCLSDPRIEWAVANLREWLAFHEGKPAAEAVAAACRRIISRFPLETDIKSTLVCTREQIRSAAKGDFAALVNSRHSVRDFAACAVDVAFIKEAMAYAAKSPSACNRQSVHVICLSRGAEMEATLSLQNGNRGFSESIDKLLIVAFDVRCYLEHQERHLGYVDAGIVVMSLICGLHYVGLGSCCLNWAADVQADQKFHAAVHLPDHLAVACLIAVGHLPEQFMVARSHRKPMEDILEIR